MSGGKKPKFSIGEPVVIVKTGAVTKITEIHWGGTRWYYQLQHYDELYAEKTLRSCKDQYDSLVREQVDLEYAFRYGDVVSVEGYPDDWFVIIGFRAEIWRYQDSAWEDIIYELSHIEDGSWLEASEEELTLVAKSQDRQNLLQKTVEKRRHTGKKERRKKVNIDQLLDMYNDYRFLYEQFGDTQYKRKMREILHKLSALAKNPYTKDSR